MEIKSISSSHLQSIINELSKNISLTLSRKCHLQSAISAHVPQDSHRLEWRIPHRNN